MARWCILRTSGGQTLPLARSLRDAGFDVWTPARTIRKVIGAHSRKGARVVELDVPILPTFVFAREPQVDALTLLARLPFSAHPAFSIFSHCGKVPKIADQAIAGLRAEEERANAVIQAMRDAESYAAAERIRIAAIKSEGLRRRAERAAERERLSALRSSGCAVAPGTAVVVAEMPALVGVTGVVESIDGTYAEVRFGTRSWKIEGWRLSAYELDQDAA